MDTNSALPTGRPARTPGGRPAHRVLHRLRIASQAAFFALFAALLLGTRIVSGTNAIGPVERFFHFDPLLGTAALLASRSWFAPFLWALATVAVTVLFGRYVCGWACPLGAVLQFFSFLFKKTRAHVPSHEETRLLHLKYAILAATLAGALLGVDLAGILDPLSLLFRSLAVAVLPAFSVSASAALAAIQGLGWSSVPQDIGRALADLTINSTFHQGLFVGTLFLAVVCLSLWRERFFCRYVCPAGALLGLLARWNLVKVAIDQARCTGCRACSLHCPTQAAPYPAAGWRPLECVRCYSCSTRCPSGAVSFPLSVSRHASPRLDPRRRWMLAGALGLAAAPLFHVVPRKRAPAGLIRPPGALPEERFLAACVKCGECMKVCPTNALQPALGLAGPDGIWTPVLVPRIGYCEYYCSLCTQVCPTGALRELQASAKRRIRIGSAWVKKDKCLPYAFGRRCRVCEEQCPTSPKAIGMVETELMAPDGTWGPQLVPVVDLDICIGCGICETKCPVEDEPAIYCTSLGESRAEES